LDAFPQRIGQQPVGQRWLNRPGIGRDSGGLV
jgi:hypothetical protein